jgi:hypothetical protein
MALRGLSTLDQEGAISGPDNPSLSLVLLAWLRTLTAWSAPNNPLSAQSPRWIHPPTSEAVGSQPNPNPP